MRKLPPLYERVSLEAETPHAERQRRWPDEPNLTNHHTADQSKGLSMAKGRKRKMIPAEPLQEPTDAQQVNGDYERVTIIHAETAQRATVHINRGGTPVARWKRERALSDSQIAAIDYCTRLWELSGLRQRTTANYGEHIPMTGSNEHAAAVTLDARNTLWRIIDHFCGPLRTYWQVFENVCRHDMPAGVAGSELTRTSRSAETRAHQVVCFVADFIAMKEKL